MRKTTEQGCKRCLCLAGLAGLAGETLLGLCPSICNCKKMLILNITVCSSPSFHQRLFVHQDRKSEWPQLPFWHFQIVLLLALHWELPASPAKQECYSADSSRQHLRARLKQKTLTKPLDCIVQVSPGGDPYQPPGGHLAQRSESFHAEEVVS